MRFRKDRNSSPPIETEELREQLVSAVTQALSEINPDNAGVVVVQNLTVNVNVHSINSAVGGGATVNVRINSATGQGTVKALERSEDGEEYGRPSSRSNILSRLTQ